MNISKELIKHWASLCKDSEQNAIRTEATVVEDSGQNTHREDLLCEMANIWKKDTMLPMNIWIDEQQTYVQSGHSRRIKFQLDTSSWLNPHNQGTMDLDGNLHPSNLDIGELHASDLTQLRNFVYNNKYALEHIADMEVWISQIWDDIIKGGEPASDIAVAELKRKVDKAIADNRVDYD